MAPALCVHVGQTIMNAAVVQLFVGMGCPQEVVEHSCWRHREPCPAACPRAAAGGQAGRQRAA
jgi:hypothetical protein